MEKALSTALTTVAAVLWALLASCSSASNDLVRIEVTPASSSFALGTTQALVATGFTEHGQTLDLTVSVLWSSSDEAIATLSDSVVTAMAQGNVEITALDARSGVRGTVQLSVTEAQLVSMSLTPPAPQLALGTGIQLTATGTFTDSTVQDITGMVQWSSSEQSVATVSGGLVQSASTGAATLTATDSTSGVQASTALVVTEAALVSIEVTPSNPSIALGTTVAMTATGIYSDSTTQDLTSSAQWTTTDAAVAGVDASGVVLSVGIGSATLTATDTDSTIQGSTSISITPATLVSIAVTPMAPSLALGTQQQLTATGTFTDATTQDLTASVTWSSSSDPIAAVSNALGIEGLVTGAGVGTATISATDPSTAIAGIAGIDVVPATLVTIDVTPTSPSIALGLDQQFTATGTYTDASTQDLTASVTWSSSAPGVASISNALGTEGLATGAAAGPTTITAIDPTTLVQGDVPLTVTAAELVSIAVTPSNPSIPLGLDLQFTATGTYTDATTQDLTSTVTWSSSSVGIATISNAGGTRGLASSVGAGSTTVTATDPASMIAGGEGLTVTAAALVSIAVTPTSPSIALGTDQQFTATGTYTDASTQNLTGSVTWASSAGAIAAISNAGGSEGLASSAGTGSATISATDPATMIVGDTALTVTAAELISIAVTPSTPSVALGLQQQFTATGTYTDASIQNLTAAVTWSSSTPATAAISNAGGSEGLATSAGVGSTVVTATDPSTMIAGGTSLDVTTAELVSIAVTPGSPSIALGTDQQFTATGTYTDASTLDLTTAVTWSSSATASATVSNAGGSQGLASSVATGSTTISATDPATMITGDTVLTVGAAVLASIAVTPSSPTIVSGSTEGFSATGTFTDASTQDLTDSVTWTSSASGVATISNTGGTEGLATAVGVGATTITATDPSTMVAGGTTLDVIAQIAFIAATSAAEASNLDLAVAVPPGTTAGDVLLAAVAIRPSSAIVTAPAGWTLIRRTDSAAGADNSLAVYRRLATAAEPGDYTWSFSESTGSVGAMTSFQGVDQSGPVDQEDGVATASSTTHDAPSLTTTRAGTMLVTAHGFSSATTWTQPAGMTEVVDAASITPDQATGIALCVSYELLPAAGATGTRTATASSNSDSGNAHAIALSPGP